MSMLQEITNVLNSTCLLSWCSGFEWTHLP